jgi:hypothetical protein
MYKFLVALLLLAGCGYRPVPPICQVFEHGDVIVDKADNYCVLKPSTGPFKEIPCNVAKTCFPEKFEDQNVSR